MHGSKAIRTILGVLAAAGLANVAAAGLEPVDAFSLVPRVPAEDTNPWPEAWESAFQQRLRDWLDRWQYEPPETTWKSE